MHKFFNWIFFLAYLSVIGFFAYRPFKLIPGLKYERTGIALEDKHGGIELRKALMNTGEISLEILLQTDSLKQGGPARIISFSRDPMRRNFTLGQSGNGVVFRLRTTETDDNGMRPCLLVPRVFDHDRMQHLVLTYNGSKVRLYVDGLLHPASIELQGGFDNWGRDHLLTVGDEPPGDRPWRGSIERFSIFDRAISPAEVQALYKGTSIGPPLYAFQGLEDSRIKSALKPLEFRNLVVTNGNGFNLGDCLANIVAFMPLAWLVYFVLPVWLKNAKRWSVFIIPAFLGLAVSGTIEVSQRFVAMRVPCLLDLAYNVFGTLLGCAVLSVMLRAGRNHFLIKGESK